VVILYIVVSVVSVTLWTPILVRFYRSWSKRRNPISLAICAAIALIMWASLAGMWVATNRIEANVFILATAAMSTVVAVYAHIAFYWSQKRFNDSRSDEKE
jgi:hypothetical protein